MMQKAVAKFTAVDWRDDQLVLLDQRKLPHQEVYRRYDSVSEVTKAISKMVVRGAPAIGIAAAYAVVLAARVAYTQFAEDWRHRIEDDLEMLRQARPTAVNLVAAIDKMCASFKDINGDPCPALLKTARAIHHDDMIASYNMAILGAGFIKTNSKIVTHCNTGILATGGYGTALGVINMAYQRGMVTLVYVSETRPWLQGMRLTSWELSKANIPMCLIVDSAVAKVMSDEQPDWLIVGADRIAKNGDVANKIGTYMNMLCARAHKVKTMVVAPTSTIDMQLNCGAEISIEQRSAQELLCIQNQMIGMSTTSVFNPSFDLTPASMIDVLITEKGAIEKPDCHKMQQLFC